MSRLLALLLLLCAAPLAAQTFPALSGRVVDAANILSPEQVASITARSDALEKSTGTQAIVATIPDLEGYPIEDYGYRLGRHWGIGQKDANNGVILLVAPNDRKVRVEVGYGLEPVLTDALSSIIIQRAVLPKARAGDLAGGVVDGYNAIADQLALPADEAAANVKAAAARSESSGGNLPALIFLLFFILWIWLAFRAARRGGKGGDDDDDDDGKGGGKRRRRRNTAWPVVIWGGNSGGWGGSGGGFGGGGFGGGGFGGGGGGFGGGGASGGW